MTRGDLVRALDARLRETAFGGVRGIVSEVVIELAHRDPSDDCDHGTTRLRCALCVAMLDPLADEDARYVGRVTQHEEDCPWRRARGLVHDLEERGR